MQQQNLFAGLWIIRMFLSFGSLFVYSVALISFSKKTQNLQSRASRIAISRHWPEYLVNLPVNRELTSSNYTNPFYRRSKIKHLEKLQKKPQKNRSHGITSYIKCWYWWSCRPCVTYYLQSINTWKSWCNCCAMFLLGREKTQKLPVEMLCHPLNYSKRTNVYTSFVNMGRAATILYILNWEL